MKQLKTSLSAHFVIILTIMCSGCGNKGPLVPPEAPIETESSIEVPSQMAGQVVEPEQKEVKK